MHPLSYMNTYELSPFRQDPRSKRYSTASVVSYLVTPLTLSLPMGEKKGNANATNSGPPLRRKTSRRSRRREGERVKDLLSLSLITCFPREKSFAAIPSTPLWGRVEGPNRDGRRRWAFCIYRVITRAHLYTLARGW